MFTSLEVHSLTRAKRRASNFAAVLSLMDGDLRPSEALSFRRRFSAKDPGEHRGERPRHLTLRFDDLEREADSAPMFHHVEAALAFGRQAEGALLVHCHAGISRSGAVGYALWADLLGHGRETEALDRLLAQRPEACPNGRMVRFADQALQRNGALWGAYEQRLQARDDWRDLKRRQLRAWAQDRPDLFTADELETLRTK